MVGVVIEHGVREGVGVLGAGDGVSRGRVVDVGGGEGGYGVHGRHGGHWSGLQKYNCQYLGSSCLTHVNILYICHICVGWERLFTIDGQGHGQVQPRTACCNETGCSV